MKYFIISVATLFLLFALSLENSAVVSSHVEAWCSAADAAREAAHRGDLSSAAAHMDALRADWSSQRTYYHSIMEHDELDNVEELFERASAALSSGDADGFIAEAAALSVQLRILAEMQGLSIENVL